MVPVRVVLRGGDNSGGHWVAALAMEGLWDGVVVTHLPWPTGNNYEALVLKLSQLWILNKFGRIDYVFSFPPLYSIWSHHWPICVISCSQNLREFIYIYIYIVLLLFTKRKFPLTKRQYNNISTTFELDLPGFQWCKCNPRNTVVLNVCIHENVKGREKVWESIIISW